MTAEAMMGEANGPVEISVGQFWLHRDGRRLEVHSFADGLVVLSLWGRVRGQHRLTRMRPASLLRSAKRWHPDETSTS